MKETHIDKGGGGGDTSKIGDGGGYDDISSPYMNYSDGQISPDLSKNKKCFAHPIMRVFGKKFKKDKGGYRWYDKKVKVNTLFINQNRSCYNF